jgi:hypothetical protein
MVEISPLTSLILDPGSCVRTLVTLDMLDDYARRLLLDEDANKVHQQLLAVGGYGDVHRVRP